MFQVTICITYQSFLRYIFVCCPYYAFKREPYSIYSQLPHKSPIQYGRIIKYFAFVFLGSFLFCIPTFMEYEVPDCEKQIKPMNSTRLNMGYILGYTIGADLIVRYILPIGTLLFTNIR